jgi:lipopolysaccharide/colanic/teichoic acid biosynthesis glycosyltransferase
VPDADRLTPFGQFLRSIRLDKLPELINVLRGEMSLVGPCPYLCSTYLERHTLEQTCHYEVKQNTITSWALAKPDSAGAKLS